MQGPVESIIAKGAVGALTSVATVSPWACKGMQRQIVLGH